MENRTLISLGLIGALLIVFALRFEPLMRALFITFLAVLLAIFLFGSAARLSERVGLPENLWIFVILIAFFGGLSLVGILSGAAVAEQFDQLSVQVRPALVEAGAFLSRYSWGQQLLESLQGVSFERFLPQIQDTVGVLVNAAVGVIVVLVGGLFIALEPQRYRRGLQWLAPRNDKRFGETLTALRERLYRWTIGRLASMAVIFVLTLVGLLIVGSPLPFLLALIAGLLSFIPNFGPIASGALAGLVGLSVSPRLALWILLIFLIVQFLEGNFITPLIERRAVYLPAGLIIIFQAVMGLAFGLLGLLVATPLAVAIITIVRGVRGARPAKA